MLKQKQNEILDLIAKQASRFGIDKHVAQAIAMVESNLSINFASYDSRFYKLYEPEFYSKLYRISLSTEINFQKTQWGIMGINGGLARAVGFGGFLPHLCGNETGVEWGCRYLQVLSEKHPNKKDLIAAYDAGSPFKLPTGEYINQLYVDIVERWVSSYQKRGYI